jgi:hypothetical protein
LLGFETFGGEVAAPAQEMQHDRAGVDGESVQGGALVEETGEEAAIAVAEDEGVVTTGDLP